MAQWNITVTTKENKSRVSITALEIKLPLTKPASYVGVQIGILAALFLTQVSIDTPEKAVEGSPSAWSPAMHMGNSDAVPGSWLFLGPAWPLQPNMGVKYYMENLTLAYKKLKSYLKKK